MATSKHPRLSFALLTIALVVFLACAVLPLIPMAKQPPTSAVDVGVLAICAGFAPSLPTCLRQQPRS